MKLYRINEEAPDGGYASHFTIRAAIEWELLVEVEKCVHGRYDGHWPNGKCHCGTNAHGEKGHWSSSWVEQNNRLWEPCIHKPWCLGAGLEDTE